MSTETLEWNGQLSFFKLRDLGLIHNHNEWDHVKNAFRSKPAGMKYKDIIQWLTMVNEPFRVSHLTQIN